MKYFEKKLSVFLTTLIFMVSIFVPMNIFAADEKKANNEVIIESIDYGYDKTFKIGYECPVTIKVKNNGKDFNGDIKILIPTKTIGFMSSNSYGGYDAYTKSISMESGSEKIITMDIKLDNYVDNLVKVYKDNKVVAEKSFKVLGGSFSGTPYIGVLSEDNVNMAYTKNIAISDSAQSVVVNFTEKDFPQIYNGLTSFNTIIISNFDTSKLSENQYDALKKWVEKGGNLIIGTGENYKKTLSIFKDDFIKGSVDGTSVIKSTKLDENGTELNIANLTVDNSETVLEESGKGILLKSKKQGGTILVTTFDLTNSAVVNSNKISDFITENIKVYGTDNILNENDNNLFWNVENILSTFSETNKISVKMLFSIFTIYIIFIFPSAYFILKRKDKKEKMWYAVPALAVVFSIVIIGYIKVCGVNDKYVTSLNIINLTKDSETLESYIQFNNLSKGNNKIESNYDLQRISMDQSSNYDQGKAVPNKIKSTINLDDNSFTLNDVNVIDSNKIKGNAIRTSSGDMSLELFLKDKDIMGKIKNNTDYKIEDAFVVVKDGGVIKLDTIEPKSEKEFSLITSSIVGNLKNGPWEVIDNFFNMNQVSFNKLSKKEQISESQKAEIYRMVLQNYYEKNKENYILGGLINNFNLEPIKINNKEAKQYGKNMLVTNLNTKINVESNVEINIPKEFISYSVNPLEGNFNYDSYSNSIYDNSEVEVLYELGNSFIYNSLDINFEGMNAEYKIYNKQTKTYYDIGKGNVKKSINKDEINNYLNEDGQIKIIIKTAEQGSATIPQISGKGVTK